MKIGHRYQWVKISSKGQRQQNIVFSLEVAFSLFTVSRCHSHQLRTLLQYSREVVIRELVKYVKMNRMNLTATSASCGFESIEFWESSGKTLLVYVFSR